jgi:hypothetical protein
VQNDKERDTAKVLDAFPLLLKYDKHIFIYSNIRIFHSSPQWCNSPYYWARAFPLSRIRDHTQTHTTLGRTPLDEWSARRGNLYLTIHNIHKRQTCVFPVGFESTIPASEQPRTHALDSAATGIGVCIFSPVILCIRKNYCSQPYSRVLTAYAPSGMNGPVTAGSAICQQQFYC